MTRYFTPEEAAVALEVVRPLAERMVELRRWLAARQRRHAELATLAGGNGHGNLAKEYAELTAALEERARELGECIEQIQAAGALIKDLETGLLDFPSLREGCEVLLCWRVGEDAIRYWHGPDDGFAGRRPL